MKDLPELIAEIAKVELDKVWKRANEAANATALGTVGILRENCPVAFGELRDSTHSVPGEQPQTVVDAPHAAAVERGSAPHTPDFEALVRWVKLRGFQGLYKRGTLQEESGFHVVGGMMLVPKITFSKWEGTTTREQATKVRSMLRGKIRNDNGPAFAKNGKIAKDSYSPIDAAEQVAMAISKGIEKHGTKPTFYVKKSLPQVEKLLKKEMRKAIKGGS